jgi:ATP synthase protein I
VNAKAAGPGKGRSGSRPSGRPGSARARSAGRSGGAAGRTGAAGKAGGGPAGKDAAESAAAGTRGEPVLAAAGAAAGRSAPGIGDRPTEEDSRVVLKVAAAMLRGALWPTAVVGVLGIGFGTWLRGWPGALGALCGIVLVVLACGTGIAVMRWTARSRPSAVMGAAMTSYVVKVALLLVLLLLLRHTTLFDTSVFAITMLIGVVAWTTGEAIAFTKARVPTVTPRR